MLHCKRLAAVLAAIAFATALHIPLAQAQDAQIGFTVPITATGQLMYSHRERIYEEPDAHTVNAAFRAVFHPSLMLGKHWYVYSALQIASKPFFYYDAYYDDRDISTDALQAFLGYSWTGERKAVSVKIGKLSSAFGAFPLRYDDATNPLLDQPLGYSSMAALRADALPCGVKDLPNLRYYEEYEGVMFYCGGSREESYGLMPVTLYGLAGTEVDLSYQKWDARLQMTNSSPANPQDLLSDSQHPQFAGGGGITIAQGFRVGVSAFRGPFLSHEVSAALPVGKHVNDYPASGVGADMQWARRRWSFNAEWYRTQFSYPRLTAAAAINSVYGELKGIITPRVYAAVRTNWQFNNRVSDATLGKSPLPFQPNVQAYEFAVGLRVNRMQLLKLGYEWVRHDAWKGSSKDDVLGVQFVTSLDSISKALH